MDNTRRALATLNADIDGAVNLSAMFKNAKISGIERALLADLDEAAKGAAGAADDVAAQAVGLPFEAVKKLRTLVGNELADTTLVSDVPRSKWAALYGALSDDMGVAAKNAGPEAESVWQWANQYTKTQLGRLEELSGIVSKDAPEKVFAAAVAGTSEGDTIAKRVISALPMQERREVSAALLQRLGRATPGQQNAMGDAFSTETFLSNLAKMSPQARQTLFGRTDLDGVIERVQKFAAVADTRREGGRIFANPSGSAPAAAQIGLGGGIAGGVVAAAAGQPLPLMGALAVPAMANAGAKVMTSPKVLELAATKTAMSPGAGAAMVNAAASMDAGGQAQAETMQAPDDGAWWQGMPMAADGLAAGAEPVLPQGDIQAPGMMPQAMPGFDPLDALPPVEIKSQMQRLSEAGSVDEAIAALQEPSPVDVARAETAQMMTERQRLEAARERAKADRLSAEQEMAQARALRIQAERERLMAMRARALGY